MRRFIDTLPTLREAPTGAPREGQGFHPDDIAKALHGGRAPATSNGATALLEPPQSPPRVKDGAAASKGQPRPASASPVASGEAFAASEKRSFEAFEPWRPKPAKRRQMDAPSSTDEVAQHRPPEANGADPHDRVQPAPQEDQANRERQKDAPTRSAFSVPELAAASEVAREAAIKAAVAEALGKAKVEQETELQNALAQERERSDAELVRAREEWCRDEAERLAQNLQKAFAHLSETLSQAFAEALAPLLGETVRDRAVMRFAEDVAKLAGRNAQPAPIEVTGPEDLIDALRTALGEARGIRCTPSDAAELSASLHESHITTTINAWSQDLGKTLSEPHVR